MTDFIILFAILVFIYDIYIKRQCRKLVDSSKSKEEVQKQISAALIYLQRKNLSPTIWMGCWVGLAISIILGFVYGF